MKKEHIPVSAEQSGLQSPFASLELSGLPDQPEAPAVSAPPAKKGRVVLRREKSGRAGKTVIVAADFDPSIRDGEIEELARKARKSAGCGGTVTGREIELQGDIAEKVRAFFLTEGFRVAGP